MNPLPVLYTVVTALRPVYASCMYWLYDIADCFPFLPPLLSFTEDCVADILPAVIGLSEPKPSLKASHPLTAAKSSPGAALPAELPALREMIMSKL
jgi:hypothetical protein